MPELHKLTPALGVLQDKGFKVALVTDGRMSGASGKVPAAIHVSPEALDDGPIARVMTGDMLVLDGLTGDLHVEVPDAEFTARAVNVPDLRHNRMGTGRELFGLFRDQAGSAEAGGSPLLGAALHHAHR